MAIEYGKILLDVDIGTNVQAFSNALTDLHNVGVVPGNSRFLVGTGSGTLAWETASTAKTSIGLGNVENTQLSTWAGSANITTLGTIATVGNITIADDGTIGQADGPLLKFDDGSNTLDILGCKITVHVIGEIFKFVTDTPSGGDQVRLNHAGDGVISYDGRYSASWKYNMLSLDPDTGYVGIGLASAITRLTVEGTLTLKEQASANGDTAAYGQIFVKTATPCQLWFRRDDGTEFRLDV